LSTAAAAAAAAEGPIDILDVTICHWTCSLHLRGWRSSRWQGALCSEDRSGVRFTVNSSSSSSSSSSNRSGCGADGQLLRHRIAEALLASRAVTLHALM